MEYNGSNVAAALHSFYVDGNIDTQHWLSMAQQSRDAWQFAWDLLSTEQPDYAKYFGACTICQKVKKEISTLSSEKVDELSTAIFMKLFRYNQGLNASTQSKLCEALVHLIYQIGQARLADAIQTVINQAAIICQQLASADKTGSIMRILCEFLFLIADEFPALRASEQNKEMMHQQLQNSVPTVLNYFKSVLTSAQQAARSVCLRTICSWMLLCSSTAQCVELVALMFDTLTQPDLIDDAIDSLSHFYSSNDLPSSLMGQLLTQLVKLKPLMAQSLQDATSEQAVALTNLLATTCIDQTRILITMVSKGGHEAAVSLELMCLMLQLTDAAGSYPNDEAISMSCLTFWSLLPDDMLDLEQNENAQLRQILLQICPVLMRKYTINVQNTVSHAQIEELINYREIIGEAFEAICYAITDEFLIWLFNTVQSTMSCTSVQQVEAVLYIIKSIAQPLENNRETVIKLLQLLQQLPLHLNQNLQSAAMEVMAEYKNTMPTLLT